MSGKNLVVELNAKVLLAYQIAGFSNFNISKTIGVLKLPKEAIKTFKISKTKEGKNLILCMQLHIY